jgi:glycosyltransferase involved in cell wall biosynthesis
MKKVLIITYYWPPSGGAGVQRWLKFSKYLPQFGWEPVILTIDPAFATYPAIDSSLEKEVPENIEVYKTRATDWFRIYINDKSKIPSAGFAKNLDNSIKGKFFRFIRGNFFIPDPRRGWNKYAFIKASELIEKKEIRTIVTTSPPHSTQLIGLKLKKKYPGIKWISDFRDPWTDIYYYELFYPSFISRNIDIHFEKSVLMNADIITTVGSTLGKHFESKVVGIGDKIKIIHNGYDESDFENVDPIPPERFTISFTGTISESYPIDGFLKALQKVIENGKTMLLSFTGLVSEGQKEKIITSIEKKYLEFIPYADHKGAIEKMMSSSVLLLVIAKHPGNKSFLSGKLFEYIASGKPVICLGPVDGDAALILNSSGAGKCFSYNDEVGIAEFILSTMNQLPVTDRNRPVEFSRRYLTEQMAQLL